MSIKEKVELFFQLPLKEIIAELHLRQNISMNELSKRAGVSRQSLMHAAKVEGLTWRNIKQATALTKNKGTAHWAYGLNRSTHSAFAAHSQRMASRNPAHNKKAAAKAAASRALTFRETPWPQEAVFLALLKQTSDTFIFQYPTGPYVLDFFIPEKSLAIEIDSTNKWGKERRLAANKKDAFLTNIGITVLRINKLKLHNQSAIFDILAAYNIVRK